MPYLGNPPAEAYTSTVKDSFSGDGSTTAFTLSQPSTTNDLRVVVENVIQDPTVAYSVSGTTLTFTSAPPTGTNNIYAVNLGPAVQTVVPPDGVTLTNPTVTGDLTVDTNTLFVDSTNNRVGIGDPAPSEKLNVAGNIMLEGSDQYLYLTNAGTGNSGIYVRGNTAGTYLRNHSTGKFTWEVSGSQILSADGDGLKFGSDTAAANALDDYEEGTWTPSLGGSATYNSQVGKYTKIGNQVTCWFNLYVNSIGTGSATTVTGLPFTVSNIAEFNANGNSVTYWASTATACTYLAVYVDKNSTQFKFSNTTAATSTVGTAVSVYQNGTDTYGTFTYRTG